MGGVSIAFAALIYPAFQALTLRWWSSGLRFGTIDVRSHLRTRDVYRAYARFLGYASLFSIAMGIFGGIVFSIAGAVVNVTKFETADQIAVTLLLLGAYVVAALGFSTIYRATVHLSVWQLGMESLELSGLSALEKVKAGGRASSALGEGLADALNVGGY